MLDTNDVVFWRDEGTNCSGGIETLFDVQIRGGFVEHIDICFCGADHCDGETLKFATGDLCDLAIKNFFEFEDFDQIVKITSLVLVVNKRRDVSGEYSCLKKTENSLITLILHQSGNCINVLRLCRSLL